MVSTWILILFRTCSHYQAPIPHTLSNFAPTPTLSRMSWSPNQSRTALNLGPPNIVASLEHLHDALCVPLKEPSAEADDMTEIDRRVHGMDNVTTRAGDDVVDGIMTEVRGIISPDDAGSMHISLGCWRHR